ncbi:MAG: SDR family NAD(P)-dependent oxidoreductase, partial [Acetobacteraceae bacterium]|nr:SDR family NAD(P)-dependent oxidoreductase [Acetobacteraceae bacterium]
MPELPRTPSFRLDGRRALVTGAGRGIGLGAAAALAAAGARVTLLARGAAEIEAAAGSIRAAGGEADALALDLGDVEAVRAAVLDRPAFHVLVNNAGTNRPAPFQEVTPEDFDAVLGLNLRGCFFAAQAVINAMIRDGVRGSVIN